MVKNSMTDEVKKRSLTERIRAEYSFPKIEYMSHPRFSSSFVYGMPEFEPKQLIGVIKSHSDQDGNSSETFHKFQRYTTILGYEIKLLPIFESIASLTRSNMPQETNTLDFIVWDSGVTTPKNI